MAFKLKPPFKLSSSPIYERELEEGCLGKGNKNGTILISPGLHKKAEESVIEHEEIHIEQVKRGDLDYDDDKKKRTIRQTITIHYNYGI